MVILGLDYGDKRIGVAVTDPLEIAATALDTVERTSGGEEFEEIGRLIRERGVERIVVGLPVRMDGSEGIQVRKVRSFIKDLTRSFPDVEIETSDERLSSAQAHRALSQAGASNRVRKRNVDSMSAQLILNRYLQRRTAQKRQRDEVSDDDMDSSPDEKEK
jgi:putative Holliday junction resolvase